MFSREEQRSVPEPYAVPQAAMLKCDPERCIPMQITSSRTTGTPHTLPTFVPRGTDPAVGDLSLQRARDWEADATTSTDVQPTSTLFGFVQQSGGCDAMNLVTNSLMSGLCWVRAGLEHWYRQQLHPCDLQRTSRRE